MRGKPAMSVAVMTHARTTSWSLGAWMSTVRRADLKPVERLVAYQMGTYADRNGMNVRPGVARLARDLGVSERTVSRALVVIRQKGLALLVSRSDRYRRLADLYRLVVTAGSRAARSTDISSAPSEVRTTGGPSRPDAIDVAVSEVPGLSPREAERLAARARKMVRHGMAEAVVLAALRARLPDDTASAASVLHARLLNMEGLPDRAALAWLRGRVRRWTPRRRGPSNAPRTAEAFGESSLTLSGW